MASPIEKTADVTAGGLAVFNPLWWPHDFAGWVQVVVGIAGFILICYRILVARREHRGLKEIGKAVINEMGDDA